MSKNIFFAGFPVPWSTPLHLCEKANNSPKIKIFSVDFQTNTGKLIYGMDYTVLCKYNDNWISLCIKPYSQ